MSFGLISQRLPHRISSFDELVDRLSDSATSLSEEHLLKASHWDMGEDARLREDMRFRQTPWGRWILSSSLVANDALFDKFVRELRPELILEEELAELTKAIGRNCVFCPADDRFVLHDDKLRLSAKQLTKRPLIEDSILDIEKFTTHLPVHSLKAAAASEPAGEWGPNTQEQHIETLGWVRVSAPGRRKFNERMFVAQLEGHSMDDGRSGLVNGGYAIFELWPEGTRQNISVLVRASFSDPETGSYAVKKYVGDIRDEEGKHHEIRLVSLNPDKMRYPDIIVNEDENVTVVAKVIQSLGPEDFAREPKRPRRPGHRNLRDPDQIEDLEKRLRKLSDRFFNGAIGATEEPEPTDIDWKARLICLDVESGALCVETRPLSWLPSFAKKLAVASNDQQLRVVLASNLKSLTYRTSVAPSAHPYRWSADPPNDFIDTDERLRECSVEGLSAESCSVFKVDSSDVGQLLSGNTLSFGCSYRVIVPPSIELIQTAFGTVSELDAGWKLWDLSLPATPPLELTNILANLGFTLGPTEPVARWVANPPVKYQQSPKGETYPVFRTNQQPVLHVSGLTASIPGELLLLVAGDSDFQTHPLKPGTEWFVSLNNLSTGSYLVQVIHEKTKFSTLNVPFAVIVDDVVLEAPTNLEVRIGERIFLPNEIGEIYVNTDLLKDEAVESESLKVTAPPYWTFTVHYDDGNRRKGHDLVAEADGTVCLDELWETIQHQLQKTPTAVYALDAAELGTVFIQHSHRYTINILKDFCSSMLLARKGSFVEIDGRFPLLRKLWLDPIFEKLGYGWQELSGEHTLEFPDGAMACILTIPEFDESFRVRKKPACVVIMTSSHHQWEIADSVRDVANSLCKHYKLSEAVLTDGTRWAKHRQNSKLKLKVFDLPKALQSEDPSVFEDFVRDFANPSAVED